MDLATLESFGLTENDRKLPTIIFRCRGWLKDGKNKNKICFNYSVCCQHNVTKFHKSEGKTDLLT